MRLLGTTPLPTHTHTHHTLTLTYKYKVWIMELIGKGPGYQGAVWVARLIPDGYVAGHANQARIQTFPQNDPTTCLYAPDLFSFAIEKGLYPATAPLSDFSFSDIFDPVSFTSARFCEARVWSMFNAVNSNMSQVKHYKYISGVVMV